MLEVLFVGDGDDAKENISSELLDLDRRIRPLYYSSVNSFLEAQNGYKPSAVFISSRSEKIVKSNLQELNKLGNRCPVIVSGGSNSAFIQELLLKGKVLSFISNDDLEKRNDECLLKVWRLIKASAEDIYTGGIEAKFRKYDNSHIKKSEAIMVTDLEGKVTYANKAFLEIIDLNMEHDVIGKILIEDLGSFGNANLLLDELQMGGGWHGELVLTNSQGNQVYTNFYASLVYENEGFPSRVVYSFRDVTQEKQAKAKLQRVNRTLQIIRKCNSVILSSNDEKSLVKQICKVIVQSAGYPIALVSYMVEGEVTPVVTSARNYKDSRIIEDIFACERKLAKRLNRCVFSSKPMIIKDITKDCNCGSIRKKLFQADINSILCFPLKDKDKIIGMMGIGAREIVGVEEEEVVSLAEMADDMAYAISALRLQVVHENLEMALLRQKGLTRKRYGEIDELSKVLEVYDYSVTNALKVPLRYIEGYTQLLQENYSGNLGEDGRKYLGVIYKSVKDANKITDNLSLLSKAAHQNIEIERVNFSLIGNSVAANLQQLNPERHATFVIADDMHTWASLHLTTVLIEILFENAWESTENIPDQRVEFGQLELEEDKVFYVKDNGCGFDPKRASQIFKPFHSFHTDGSFEGTGLGLATAERIVKRHEGRIWAEGEAGKGATFYFTIKKTAV